jgi:hypothetical protein
VKKSEKGHSETDLIPGSFIDSRPIFIYYFFEANLFRRSTASVLSKGTNTMLVSSLSSSKIEVAARADLNEVL